MSKFEFQIRFDQELNGNTTFSPEAIRMIVEQLPETPVFEDLSGITPVGIVDKAELEEKDSVKVIASLPDRFTDLKPDYPCSKILYKVTEFEMRGEERYITGAKVSSISLS